MEPTKPEQAGFSLVEVLIASAVLAILVSAVLGIMVVGLQTFNSGNAITVIQNQARRIMDSIAKEIQPAGLSTISPTPPALGSAGTHTITFQPCTGYDGASDPPQQWGNVTTIAFAYDSGETNDGVDNNGDGLIDEGLVTKTVVGATSSQTKILGHWVKENGLSFNLDGTLLTITLEMQKRGGKNELLETSLTTTVQIKND